MADHSRLDDLRRRVQKDPASIAFAQLAEEYRRAGEYQQAVEVCSAGLAIHPGYLSARVTLGRALIELNQLEEAQEEIERVLHSAPENLAAIRGLAEIHHRRGEREQALAQYRAALALAPNDPDLEETVNDLARQLEPPARRADPADGLSLEQVAAAFSENVRPRSVAPAPPPVSEQATAEMPAEAPDPEPAPVLALVPRPSAMVELTAGRPAPHDEAVHDIREERTVAALEAWLSAIHVARANHSR
jgi:tetratricopeptide (TPR) repeat protein